MTAAIEQKSSDTDDDFETGLTALDKGRFAEAASSFEHVLGTQPDNASAHGNLGVALHSLERYAEALDHFRRAIELKPTLAEPYNNVANLLTELGEFDQARQAFTMAILLAPRRGTFHYGLAGAKTFDKADAQIPAMQYLLESGEPLEHDDDRMLLHFALGKAHDDCGNVEASFRHLLAGNALKRARIAYDESAELGELGRIAAVFDRDLIERLGGIGHPTERPIFVVGMPRSGTTLVEQILASHPGVAAAGERYDLFDVAQDLAPFPESVASMDESAFAQAGLDYLRAMEAARRPSFRITDKMPWNFKFLGLIALILPNAHVIHVMRDPVETCLSCFSKYFARHQEFTYDLGELGRYYRAYHRLMDHWRQVLPPGLMIDVQYEDVTADLETQARRIVDHCGLPWSDSCLAFDKTKRPVRTASAVQVRQPLYRTAGQRWQPYRAYVGPLLDALGDVYPPQK